LQLNGAESLTLNSNNAFTFVTRLAAGVNYGVTITQQPQGLACVVDSGSGVMGSADVVSVSVSCGPLYSIGGSITGLAAPGLALQLNGGNDLGITVGNSFVFPTKLPSGAAYAISVRNNPTGQTCSVTSGAAGHITQANVTNVAITCTTPPVITPSLYSIGGAVSGLTESGLIISNLIEPLSVTANSTQFTFPTLVTSGTAYNVSILQQPPHITCGVLQGIGTVAAGLVTTIGITCTPNVSQAGFTVDKALLAFTAEQGAPLASQAITGTVQGATAPVYVRIGSTNAGILGAYYSPLSATSGQVIVTPASSARAAQILNDTITVTVCYDDPCTQHLAGSPKVIPVTTTITAAAPPAVLKVSDYGVALIKGPTQSRLSKTIKVTDTSGAASTWTAVANQSWLTVTPSGVSGSNVVVTADPVSLTSGFYTAAVTLNSSNSQLATQTIRVGLYVTNQAPATSFTAMPIPSEFDDGTFAADALRPLVYTSRGSDISVDHTYSGSHVATISIAGSTLSRLTVSDDGRYLYALDIASLAGSGLRIHVIDLASQQLLASTTLSLTSTDAYYSRIEFVRVNNKPALFFIGAADNLGRSPVLDAATLQEIGRYTGYPAFFVRMKFSRAGNAMYVTDNRLSAPEFTLTQFDLIRNSQGNVTAIPMAGVVQSQGAGNVDLAINGDGSAVYVVRRYNFGANGALYAYTVNNHVFQSVTPLTFPAPILPYWENLEFNGDDRLVYTTSNGTALRYYNADGTLRYEDLLQSSPSVVDGEIDTVRFTSDGLRIFGNGRILSLP